jgi:hypothetical protein
MRGTDTLYNTYWIHSNYGADAFAGAVRRSQQLLPRPVGPGFVAWSISALPIPRRPIIRITRAKLRWKRL